MEGIGESDWCRSKWLDTAEHSHGHGGIKRGEQTCQDKVRTWRLESRSINNTVDKGLYNVFLKCDITAFNGNWTGRVSLSSPLKKKKKNLTCFILLPMLLQGNSQQTSSDGPPLSMLACQDIIQHRKQLIQIFSCHRVHL